MLYQPGTLLRVVLNNPPNLPVVAYTGSIGVDGAYIAARIVPAFMSACLSVIPLETVASLSCPHLFAADILGQPTRA